MPSRTLEMLDATPSDDEGCAPLWSAIAGVPEPAGPEPALVRALLDDTSLYNEAIGYCRGADDVQREEDLEALWRAYKANVVALAECVRLPVVGPRETLEHPDEVAEVLTEARRCLYHGTNWRHNVALWSSFLGPVLALRALVHGEEARLTVLMHELGYSSPGNTYDLQDGLLAIVREVAHLCECTHPQDVKDSRNRILHQLGMLPMPRGMLHSKAQAAALREARARELEGEDEDGFVAGAANRTASPGRRGGMY
jgi:hypothetical protein